MNRLASAVNAISPSNRITVWDPANQTIIEEARSDG